MFATRQSRLKIVRSLTTARMRVTVLLRKTRMIDGALFAQSSSSSTGDIQNAAFEK